MLGIIITSFIILCLGYKLFYWVIYLVVIMVQEITITHMSFLMFRYFLYTFFFVPLKFIISTIIAFITTANMLNFILLFFLMTYLIFNIFMYFFWSSIGLRGIFFINECLIISLLIQLFIYITHALKTNCYIFATFGEFMIHDDLLMTCLINLDFLATIGVITVLILTGIVLTFGIEYLSREAFAYNVIVILGAFSSSIVWFIVSYAFGMMIVFWELAGFFSLLLVDTFYSRIRTTQAVNRTFTIGRFSDYAILLGVSEMLSIFESDSLVVIFACIKAIIDESPILVIELFENPAMVFALICFYVAASCKCAQFMLFVWLPDAMEAPTPASALIHSSTLVVMGIFMLLRLMPLFANSATILTVFTLTGAITIAYGAISSVRTSDLKKAVAYSTISQVGYLYCGCGLLAINETLIYLVVHAICKAMLFIFVGYIVHLFGGTTSLRKMGGVFYIVPDIAIYVFILCVTLAGAPYTLGFLAKEFIICKILASKTVATFFILICWLVAFICTPIYLFRICILPFFGRPRATWYRFKNIAFIKTRESYFAKKAWDVNNAEIFPLFFFYNNFRHTLITSRLTLFLHFIIIINILIFGEFIFLLLSGFFNTTTGMTLLSSYTFKFVFFSYMSLHSKLLFYIQLLILVILFTIICYFVLDVKVFGKNVLRFLIIMLLLLLFVSITLFVITTAGTLL